MLMSCDVVDIGHEPKYLPQHHGGWFSSKNHRVALAQGATSDMQVIDVRSEGGGARESVPPRGCRCVPRGLSYRPTHSQSKAASPGEKADDRLGSACELLDRPSYWASLI